MAMASELGLGSQTAPANACSAVARSKLEGYMVPNPTLEEMVRRVLAGEQPALVALRARYRRKLTALIAAVIPPSEGADSLASDILLDVENALPEALRDLQPGQDGLEMVLDARLVALTRKHIFAALWKKHEHRLICAIRYYLPDRLCRERAEEDILQETARVATMKFSSLTWQGQSQFLSWLKTIAIHQIWDRVKRDRRTIPVVPGHLADKDGEAWPRLLEAQAGQTDVRPSTIFRMAERVKRLHDALMRLSDAERNALRMHYWEQKTYREIGQIIGSKPDAVKSLCWRARQELRKILGESFMNSGSQ